MLSVMLVAGCGGGGSSNADCEKFHAGPAYLACINGEPIPTSETGSNGSAENAATETPEEEEAGGSLAYVGTITGIGEGTGFKNTFHLGPLLYGQEDSPPESVLSACLVSGIAAIERSVFARGEVTVAYTEGSLPETLTLPSELVRTGGLQATLAALKVDGQWYCTAEDLINTGVEFQPGEAQTFPFWVVDPGVLSNESPRLPAKVRNAWYFGFMGRVGNQTKLWVSGPGRGWCEDDYTDEWRLFLYNRSGGC